VIKSSVTPGLYEQPMPQGVNEVHAKEIEALRLRSGEEVSDNPLVSFLYELMRDHVTPGVLEAIVLNSPAKKTKLSNGYLAQYAKDLAYRLENMKGVRL
jgi:hypothetical protein